MLSTSGTVEHVEASAVAGACCTILWSLFFHPWKAFVMLHDSVEPVLTPRGSVCHTLGERLAAGVSSCAASWSTVRVRVRGFSGFWGAWLQADEPLGRFLDYCTYGHMIDNVVLIVTGTLHERDVHVRAHFSLLHKCTGIL